MTEEIAVVIVDDHPVYRKGLASALSDADGVVLVGEAASGEESLAVVESAEHVDVVLMDLHMAGVGGISATRSLRLAYPGIAVLVITMSADTELLGAALRAGARGYLVKGANQERIVSAIRAVAAGEFVVGADAASGMQQLLSTDGAAAVPFPELTAREREILDLVARGLDNEAIARSLYLSAKTVRNYVSAVLGKLRVATRAGAVARARDAGMGR